MERQRVRQQASVWQKFIRRSGCVSRSFRQHKQVRHNLLHIRGRELVSRHEASRRKRLWIGKVAFDPIASATLAQAV